MALPKKANIWYAYCRDIDGRQVKRSLHTGDRAIAEIREKAMKEMIREVKFRAAGTFRFCSIFSPVALVNLFRQSVCLLVKMAQNLEIVNDFL